MTTRRLLPKGTEMKDNNSHGSEKEIRNGSPVLNILHIQCGRWLLKELFAATMVVIISRISSQKWCGLSTLSLITPQCFGSIHRRKNWQCWCMQPSPSDHPETVSWFIFVCLFFSIFTDKDSVLKVTWLSPSLPQPQVRVFHPHKAVYGQNALRQECGAPVPMKV